MYWKLCVAFLILREIFAKPRAPSCPILIHIVVLSSSIYLITRWYRNLSWYNAIVVPQAYVVSYSLPILLGVHNVDSSSECSNSFKILRLPLYLQSISETCVQAIMKSLVFIASLAALSCLPLVFSASSSHYITSCYLFPDFVYNRRLPGPRLPAIAGIFLIASFRKQYSYTHRLNEGG